MCVKYNFIIKSCKFCLMAIQFPLLSKKMLSCYLGYHFFDFLKIIQLVTTFYLIGMQNATF